MKTGPLIILVAIAAFAGVIAPYLPTVDGSDRVEAEEAQSGDPLPTVARLGDEWLAGQTVLKRRSDGHFYADVVVEGGPVHFLVDTGASIVALTGKDAAALGLRWDDSQLQPIGRGANGTVLGVPIRLGRMDLNGLQADDVPAAIIPYGLDVSLLGQSFLSQIQTVGISGDEMRLGG